MWAPPPCTLKLSPLFAFQSLEQSSVGDKNFFISFKIDNKITYIPNSDPLIPSIRAGLGHICHRHGLYTLVYSNQCITAMSAANVTRPWWAKTWFVNTGQYRVTAVPNTNSSLGKKIGEDLGIQDVEQSLPYLLDFMRSVANKVDFPLMTLLHFNQIRWIYIWS